MKQPNAVVIFVTAPSKKEARKIADCLLSRKKAACVNIIPGVHSTFWWEGKIDSADEVLLIVKSEKKHLERIVKLIKQLHSYEVPEVVAVPVIGGNEEYLSWLHNSVS